MVQATVLQEAYAHCQRVTKAEAKNFYYAFVTLPKAKRQAIYAVYAFCRLCDDIADEPLPVDEKRRKLREVDVALEQSRDGNPDGPVYSALAHAVREYGIPWEDLSEVARGVEMDLTLSRYETFEDLATYCYRVASVVGIICIHIFGFSDPLAREYAVDLGLGMQLTNILRDIKEDAEMDRVYLPQEELRRFGYPEEALMAGADQRRVHPADALPGRPCARLLRQRQATVAPAPGTLSSVSGGARRAVQPCPGPHRTAGLRRL